MKRCILRKLECGCPHISPGVQVAHQVKVIEDQLARDDVDEWERDILLSELDLLNNIRNSHTPHT